MRYLKEKPFIKALLGVQYSINHIIDMYGEGKTPWNVTSKHQPKRRPFEEHLVVYSSSTNPSIHNRIGIGEYKGNGEWSVRNESKPIVTHWMPLPDLPDVQTNAQDDGGATDV